MTVVFLIRQADLCSAGRPSADPFELLPLARFDRHAGVQRETSHSVRNEWLFCAGQGLQGEDLAPLMRAGGNAIGDRVPLQLIHWVFIRLVQCQIAVLGISYQ